MRNVSKSVPTPGGTKKDRRVIRRCVSVPCSRCKRVSAFVKHLAGELGSLRSGGRRDGADTVSYMNLVHIGAGTVALVRISDTRKLHLLRDVTVERISRCQWLCEKYCTYVAHSATCERVIRRSCHCVPCNGRRRQKHRLLCNVAIERNGE